jgi:hypothetical protein
MTTPTQAQIEVAETIVKQLHGLQGFDAWVNHIAKHLPAAAQVGEQDKPASRKLLNIFKAMWRDAEKECEEIEAATIERCAQEGVEFLQGLAATWRKVHGKIKPTDAANCLEQAIEGFAAAIRKLKDQ